MVWISLREKLRAPQEDEVKTLNPGQTTFRPRGVSKKMHIGIVRGWKGEREEVENKETENRMHVR